MLLVQEAYAMYSGHELMLSCEYLDEHDHIVELRTIGIDRRYVAGTSSHAMYSGDV